MKMSGHHHAPADLPWRKVSPVPIGQEAGYLRNGLDAVGKRKLSWSSWELNTDSSPTQPLVHWYSDWTNPAPAVKI
jgi:hypothetical protein